MDSVTKGVFAETKKHTITLRAGLGEVERARRAIGRLAIDEGFSDARRFDIEVASSEAIANATEHSPPGSPVVVHVRLHRDRMEVDVEGRGEFKVPAAAAAERRHRGLGLPLMAKLSDRLALCSGSDGGTRVSLTFCRPDSAWEPTGKAARSRVEGRSPRHVRMGSEAQPASATWLIPLFWAAVIAVLGALRLHYFVNPPGLFPALNLVFLTLLFGVVTLLAVRRYRSDGSLALLLTACGSLAIALSSLAAAVTALIASSNEVVAIAQTGFVLAGACHLGGAAWWMTRTAIRPVPRRPALAVGLGLTVGIIVALIVLIHQGAWPMHIIQGDRTTAFGSFVAGLAAALFALSALFLLLEPTHSRSGLGRWYALGLLVIAVGLTGAALQLGLGGPVFWAARAALYSGAVVILLGIVLSARETGVWSLPFEAALRETQARYESLVEVSPDAVLVAREGRYLFANEAAARLFGAGSAKELIGAAMPGVLWPEAGTERTAPNGDRSETRIMRLDGTAVDVEVAGAEIQVQGRPAVQLVVRDVTARKRAEAERERLLDEQRRLAEDLAALNFDLQQHHEELAAANEELQSQTEELAAQGEELQTQTEELAAREEELTAQNEQLMLAYERLGDSARFGEVLNELNRAMMSALDRRRILRVAVEEGVLALAAQRGVLEVREGEDWIIQETVGLPSYLQGRRLSAAQASVATAMYSAGDVLAITDGRLDTRVNPGTLVRYHTGADLVTPLVLQAETMGSLHFIWDGPRSFSDVEIDFARKLGASVSMALDNAFLHERQASLLERLQRPFLQMPDSLPSVEFAAEYRSATTGAQVGGDFYDLYLIPDGRLALIVGDVSGHGLEASRFASMVKDSFSLLLIQGERPRSVLAQTNRFLLQRNLPGFVTAFLGLLDLNTGELTYSAAGHPRPFLAVADGPVRPLHVAGSAPLAVFRDSAYEERRAELSEDDLLVLYTDGLTEARRDGGFYGEDGLMNSVERHKHMPAAYLVETLVRDVLDFAEGALTDDAALLTVRFRGTRDGGSGAPSSE